MKKKVFAKTDCFANDKPELDNDFNFNEDTINQQISQFNNCFKNNSYYILIYLLRTLNKDDIGKIWFLSTSITNQALVARFPINYYFNVSLLSIFSFYLVSNVWGTLVITMSMIFFQNSIDLNWVLNSMLSFYYFPFLLGVSITSAVLTFATLRLLTKFTHSCVKKKKSANFLLGSHTIVILLLSLFNVLNYMAIFGFKITFTPSSFVKFNLLCSTTIFILTVMLSETEKYIYSKCYLFKNFSKKDQVDLLSLFPIDKVLREQCNIDKR